MPVWGFMEAVDGLVFLWGGERWGLLSRCRLCYRTVDYLTSEPQSIQAVSMRRIYSYISTSWHPGSPSASPILGGYIKNRKLPVVKQG